MRAEMRRMIEEALLQDDRIREVDGFRFEFSGDSCHCSFQVSSIYEEIQIEKRWLYDKMTYEKLLQAMLDRVPSDVDKREGSVIYDALAPCAYFLAQQNFQLDNFIDLVFPDTALGEYLNRAAEAYNVSRKPATNAVRKMTTSGSVEIGTRWESVSCSIL